MPQSPEPSAALASGSRLGPYEVVCLLGSGGMGEVYRAKDTRLAREVALKVLPPAFSSDPDRLRRFEVEARAASLLNHPNIVTLHDVGSHEGVPYVVSELLQGETLGERMRAGEITPRKAVDYALQALRGLGAAHERGIVHRDLKPENLFVTTDGHVKILDFGLAKLRPEAVEGSGTGVSTQSHSDAATVLGTLGYMSPEQVKGLPADHRSDIFALGAVLYEMVARGRAFRGESPAETMAAILNEDPPELRPGASGIACAVDRVARRCLEKPPEDRFQSARDAAFALEAVSGTSATRPVAAAPVGSRRRLLALSAVLLAMGGLLGALAGPWLHRETTGPASYRRLTFRRGEITNARWTSDGATVVYSAAWDGKPLELYTSRVDSPEWRPLGIQGRLLSVSSTGELAIRTPSGTLARVPLQGGAPREVQSGVWDADWSPDGKQLAVVRIVEGRYRLEYPMGTVLHESGAIVAARVSPDGSRVALVEPRVAGFWTRSLRVVDRSGKPTTLATAEGLERVCWSPDGSEVWFSRLTDPRRSLSVYAVTLAGKERLFAHAPGWLIPQDVARDGRLLVMRDDASYEMRGQAPGETREKDLSWLDRSISADLSVDGRSVLFWETGSASRASIYVRGTDGSPATRLGEGIALGLSPDRKWALAITEEPPHLLLLPTGPAEPRRLPTHGMNYSVVGGAWFPDGNRVLFFGQEPGRGFRWYVQDLEGGAPRPVTPEGSPTRGALSPDGRFVAAGPLLYPVEGGEPRPLPGLVRQRPPGRMERGRALALRVPRYGPRPRVPLRARHRKEGAVEGAGSPGHHGCELDLQGPRHTGRSLVRLQLRAQPFRALSRRGAQVIL